MNGNFDRRKFVKAGSAVAAGVTLGIPAIVSGRTPSKKDEIKIGVIGTGSRGTGLIRIMRDIPELRVMACCDVLPFRLEEAMKHADEKARAYTDYRALLDNKKLDAVLISTPLSMHSEMAIAALDADKHVYCEKSLAYDIDQVLKLRARAKKSDKTFQVGYQYHSSRLYYQIVETIREGWIGNVTGFVCQWNRNGDWRRPVPDPQYERIINWRMYREYSCGLLAELSSHQIDLVNWMTEGHPLSVIGTGGIDYWKDGRETFDNVHVIFEYPNGVKASFTSLTANAYEGYQIRILGDKATIVIDTFNSAFIYPEASIRKELGMVDGVSGATAPLMDDEGKIPINVEHMDPSKQALMDFVDNIINSKEPLSNVDSGAKSAIAMRMALNSIMKGTREVWQESYSVG